LHSLEEIIELILKHLPEYERKDILELIEEKRQELGAEIVNEESAAMIVARDLGIDLRQVSPKTRLKIEDIADGNRNVNLTAKVVSVGTVRTFDRNDDTQGRVTSITVGDDTGRLRVVLWDEQTKIVSEKKINVNDVVQIRGGYVKKGLGDSLELNIGRMGRIVPLDEYEMEELDLEVPDAKQIKIEDLKEGVYDVTLTVQVIRVFRFTTFTRKSDGKEGKVISLRGADETGSIRLVFWDDNAEKMKDISEGEIIRVTGGYTREGRNGEIELHAGRTSTIEKGLDKEIEVSEELGETRESLGKKPISELELGMWDVDIEAKVVNVFPPKSFEKKNGTEGKVQNFVVADESGSIRITIWDDRVNQLEELKEGDIIRVEHGYVKEGFRDDVEFHLGQRAKIERNPGDSNLDQLDTSTIATKGPVRQGRVMIDDIDEDDERKYVEICGIIVSIVQTSPIYLACPECSKKVQEQDGNYSCRVCGLVEEPEPRMLFRVTIDDGSESIRTTLFGQTAEKLLGLTAAEANKMISETGNQTEPLEKYSDTILGKYVVVQGRVKKYKDSINLSASNLNFADPVDEIKRLKESISSLLS
jgi:replication factor A1